MYETNPYQSPQATIDEAPLPQESKRPVSPKVLGILTIVFGTFGLVSASTNFFTADMVLETDDSTYDQLGYGVSYLRLILVLGAFSSMWLLATGIGLVKYRNWGRLSFNAYAWFTIVMTLGNSSYLIYSVLSSEISNPAAIDIAIIASFGSLIDLVIPVLGLVYLNRRIVRESLS